MFVEDLHTGVELGRIWYGKSGVRNPGRVSDKGAHCGSVELCAQEGDPNEAIAAFQKAAAADPANAEPYFYMGTILVGQNKVPDAVTSLEKYLSMNPTNAQNVATAQGLLQALKPKK